MEASILSARLMTRAVLQECNPHGFGIVCSPGHMCNAYPASRDPLQHLSVELGSDQAPVPGLTADPAQAWQQEQLQLGVSEMGYLSGPVCMPSWLAASAWPLSPGCAWANGAMVHDTEGTSSWSGRGDHVPAVSDSGALLFGCCRLAKVLPCF